MNKHKVRPTSGLLIGDQRTIRTRDGLHLTNPGIDCEWPFWIQGISPVPWPLRPEAIAMHPTAPRTRLEQGALLRRHTMVVALVIFQ